MKKEVEFTAHDKILVGGNLKYFNIHNKIMNDNKEGKCDNCGNSLGKKGSDGSYSREFISYCKNGGKVYSFCSSKCSEKFLGEPAKEVKAPKTPTKPEPVGETIVRRKCDACGKPLWKKHGKGYTSSGPVFGNSKTGKEYCSETCQNNGRKITTNEHSANSPSQPNGWIIALMIMGGIGMIGIIIYNVWRTKKK